MSYLIIAYPQISEKDFSWIQDYRKKNDKRYFSVVKPHFTVVFPISDILQEDFLTEAEKQISNVEKFEFELKVGTINLDDSGKYYHEFFVPEKGYSNIVKLHDRLYSGRFSGYLRHDIDFIPHIGIGNSLNVRESKQRIDQLNESEVSISGIIDCLDAIEYKEGAVKTMKRFQLN